MKATTGIGIEETLAHSAQGKGEKVTTLLSSAGFAKISRGAFLAFGGGGS